MQPLFTSKPEVWFGVQMGPQVMQVPLSCNETSKQIRILDSFSALSFLCSFLSP